MIPRRLRFCRGLGSLLLRALEKEAVRRGRWLLVGRFGVNLFCCKLVEPSVQRPCLLFFISTVSNRQTLDTEVDSPAERLYRKE